MPQVSKSKLPTNIEVQLINNFNSVLSSISQKDKMLAFLNSLLTNTERLMLAKRLAAVVLISEGKNDTEISNSLHITRMTVAKIRYFYEARAKEGFDIALKELNSQKMKEEAKKLLTSLARYSVRAAGGYVKPGILD